MTGGMSRRVEALEGLVRQRQPAAASAARGRMVEHLDRLAAWRRGELDEEEAAEVEEPNSAIRGRLEAMRGEGGS